VSGWEDWASYKDDYGRPGVAYNPNLQPLQFYHGTRAALGPGDYVEAGHGNNYPEMGDENSPDWDTEREGKSYATPVKIQARKFARQALGSGKQRVYQVEPTGHVEWDEETHAEDYSSDKDMYRRGSRRSASPWQVVREL
jgi:hypothetical protein